MHAVRGKVMFSLCLSVHTRQGGTPVSGPRSPPNLWSHALSGGTLASGPMSFLGGTPVSGPRSLPNLRSHALSRGYPSLWSHVLSRGYPIPSQGVPQSWLGTPPARTGLGYPLARTGQDWGNLPSPPGLVTPWAGCLLRFHVGGLSCFLSVFTVVSSSDITYVRTTFTPVYVINMTRCLLEESCLILDAMSII